MKGRHICHDFKYYEEKVITIKGFNKFIWRDQRFQVALFFFPFLVEHNDFCY